MLSASTLEPISTELNLTAALVLAAGIAAVDAGGGAVGGAAMGGGAAVAPGGGTDGFGEVGSLLLPQALSAMAAATAVESIRVCRVIFMGTSLASGFVRNPRDRVGLDSIRPGRPIATGIQDGLPRIRIAAETRGDCRQAASARHDAMGGRVDCGTGLSPQVAEILLRRRTRRAEIHVPRTAEKSGLSMSWPIARLAVPERGSVIARGWLTACECLRRPFSFYAVEHVVPGQGKTLRDLMTDACHQVHERSAAQSPAGHEGIYAQLAAAGTVLGRITIDGARLTAEVKSRERADLLKDIIEDRLGAAATFRADEIQTPEQAMAEGSASPSPPRPQDAPETQAILADYLRSHYKRWPDMPLPALGNRTPREVVRTAAGANRWRPCCSTRSDTTRDCPPPSTSRSSIPRVGNWAWRSELLVSAIARNIAQSLGICDSLSLRCGMDGAFRGIWNATEPRSRSAAADTDHDRRVARCVKRAQASRRHGTPAPAALPHRRQLLSRLPRRAPASAPRQPDATAPPARRPLMTNAPSRSSGAITSSGDPDERRAPVRLRMGMDPYTPLLKVSPADESQSASL